MRAHDLDWMELGFRLTPELSYYFYVHNHNKFFECGCFRYAFLGCCLSSSHQFHHTSSLLRSYAPLIVILMWPSLSYCLCSYFFCDESSFILRLVLQSRVLEHVPFFLNLPPRSCPQSQTYLLNRAFPKSGWK